MAGQPRPFVDTGLGGDLDVPRGSLTGSQITSGGGGLFFAEPARLIPAGTSLVGLIGATFNVSGPTAPLSLAIEAGLYDEALVFSAWGGPVGQAFYDTGSQAGGTLVAPFAVDNTSGGDIARHVLPVGATFQAAPDPGDAVRLVGGSGFVVGIYG
jgi:hypothetical protein